MRAKDLPLRDLDRALAIAGGNEALTTYMFELMMEDLPAQLETILQLQRKKDWPGLAERAHYLRGSVAFCAVPALEQSLIALKAAASAPADDVDLQVQALVSEVQRLLASENRDPSDRMPD